MITFEEFEKVALLTGTVVRVEEFPRARKPAFKVWVDFGDELGVRQTSAQVTHHYTPETLTGRRVVGCVNLGPKNIAGFITDFLLVGFPDENGHIVLAVPDPAASQAMSNGQKLC